MPISHSKREYSRLSYLRTFARSSKLVRSLTRRRSAFKLEKYIAEPHPVRSVLGRVPLQNCRIGFGPLAIVLIVASNVFWWLCWTRVLSRSAG